MDSIYAAIRENTSQFNLGDEEKWRELYEPFIPDPPSDITLVSDESYGPHERNTFDIYIPPSSKSAPVLIFVHGGGFFSGDKAWSKTFYGNLGYFFASQGIVTVTINHRLVPNVEYPGGAEDVQMAREWVYQNIGKRAGGDPEKVVLTGHSSGGAHVGMNLYAAKKEETVVFPPVAGVMYFSTPFWYDNQKPVRAKTLRSYYGSEEEDAWRSKCVLGLLEQVPKASPLLNSDQIPTYIGIVKYETKEATDGAMSFFNVYRAKSHPAGTLPIFHVLDGHNHLSNILSIGTEDTAQSTRILEFVTSCAERVRSEESWKQRVGEWMGWSRNFDLATYKKGLQALISGPELRSFLVILS